MTLGQLRKLYDSATVAEEIAAVKQTCQDLWRPHPEIPLCIEARQFLCEVDDCQVESAENLIRQGISMKTALGKDEGVDAVVAQEFGRIQRAVEQGAGGTSSRMLTAGVGPTPGTPLTNSDGTMVQQPVKVEPLKAEPRDLTTLAEEGPLTDEAKRALDMARELLRKEKERGAERLRKKKAAEESRKKIKDTLPYRINDWIVKFKKHIDTCDKEHEACKNNKNALPLASQKSYCETFQTLKQDLHESMAKFQELLDKEEDEPTFQTMSQSAQDLVIRFKSQFGTYGNLERTYSKLAKKAAAGAQQVPAVADAN